MGLQEETTRGYIGFRYSWMGEGRSAAPGVLIGEVLEGSPAQGAGLRPGDRVTAIQGRPLTPPVFQEVVSRLRPGDLLVLRLLREGRPLEVEVEAAAPPAPWLALAFQEAGRGTVLATWADSLRGVANRMDSTRGTLLREMEHLILAPTPYGWGQRVLAGAELTPLDADLREYFQGEDGLLVTQVAPGSPAREAGIRSGDIVIRLGNRRVRTVPEARAALEEVRGRIPITLVRHGETVLVSLPEG